MGQIQPKVALTRATVGADEIIASAGKLCYASNTDNILEQDSNDASEFIQNILKMGHTSIAEHAVFTFYIEGVSRALTHQLVRHRLASYSQRSQRYVAHDDFDYVIPDQFQDKTVSIDGREVDAVEYFEETMAIIAKRYATLRNALGDKGESSNQDARYVLPNACETKIFVTMNARELMHFFQERLCMRAQWEIRGVANQMYELVKDKCPAIFSKCGPKCVTIGHCTEGAKACGMAKEMKAKYGK